MPETNKRDYTGQHPRQGATRHGTEHPGTGAKFPSNPHEKEGMHEKCVGNQTKRKSF
jgi:hypothetical protein